METEEPNRQKVVEEMQKEEEIEINKEARVVDNKEDEHE